MSFGFRVTDENSRPVIYSEGVKALLFDFIQTKEYAIGTIYLHIAQPTSKSSEANKFHRFVYGHVGAIVASDL